MTEGFVEVAKVSDVPPGGLRRVVVDGQRVCLANVDGRIYAFEDECGHQRAALSKGTLEGTVVECPLHFARFDVRTGKAVSGPDFGRLSMPGVEQLGPEALERMQRMGEILADVDVEEVATFEVRVEGDAISVKP